MPEPPGWMWDRLEQIRRENVEHHGRLRADSDKMAAEMRSEIRLIRDELQKIRIDINAIQVQREIEEESYARKGTWIALMVSIGVSVLMKALDIFMRRP